MPAETAFSFPKPTSKVAIVTGANSGLGFETAQTLAGQGAHVIMACRNVGKAQPVADQMTAGHGGSVTVEALDLSDLESVAAFAARVQAQYDHIDLLINNAGVMACPQAQSAQGHELQWATNHLGHFALTGHLLPLLEAAPAARVVALSSIAHHSGRFRWDDLQHQQGYRAIPVYCQSKLANLVFALEMDRRLRASGSTVIAVAAHPGVSDTQLAVNGPGFAQNAVGRAATKAVCKAMLVTPLIHTQQEGAQPGIHAACAADVQGGDYFGPSGWREHAGPVGKAKINRKASDVASGQQLWAASEAQSGVSYLSV